MVRKRRGNSAIPKTQVAAVRFSGRVDHRGLVGGLIGVGVGAGVAAAVTTQFKDCSEGGCIILLPVVGVAIATIGGVTGYFIGRAASRQAPEFSITP